MKNTPQSLKNSLKEAICLYLQVCKAKKHQDRGFVLFLVLSIMFVLQALLMGYVILARIDKGTTVAATNSSKGFYSAEAGLNRRAEEVRETFNDYRELIGDASTNYGQKKLEEKNWLKYCLDNNPNNDGTGDFICKEYDFSDGSDENSRKTITRLFDKTDYDANNQPPIERIPFGQPFGGLNSLMYSYSVGSASYSGNITDEQGNTKNNTKPEAILQLGIKNRLVPLFQFAAFYKNDLEILPGPAMTLDGAVHTNSDLYLGANNSLTINGQVTLVKGKKLYNKRKNNTDVYSPKVGSLDRVTIADNSGQLKNILLAANPPMPSGGTSAALVPSQLLNIWGKKILTDMENITLPGQEKNEQNIDSEKILGVTGDYFKKADLRIQYNPTTTTTGNPVKIAVTSINRSTDPAIETVLTEGQLRSLRQAMMSSYGCTGVNASPSANQTKLADLTKVYLVSLNTFRSLSGTKAWTLSNLNSAIGGNRFRLAVEGAGFTWSSVQSQTLDTTAINAGRCFKVAPITITNNFVNNRESKRVIDLVHVNIESMTAWNKEGVYVDFANNVVTNNYSNQGKLTSDLLFKLAPADSSAPNGSFQQLGYAAADRSEGGLVFHLTVNSTATGAAGNQSPYGFAITGGAQLPGLVAYNPQQDPTGLTIASNQAIYLQGNYNCKNLDECQKDATSETAPDFFSRIGSASKTTKQPAGILADSLNVLSSNCLTADGLLNCGVSGGKPGANHTEINAAFFSGTDITNGSAYSGGLENYPRFHEEWTNKGLLYRGSFVSLYVASHVSGSWGSQVYGAPNRNWNYDIEFNEFRNLPPLTPNIVYLWQEKFGRVLEQE